MEINILSYQNVTPVTLLAIPTKGGEKWEHETERNGGKGDWNTSIHQSILNLPEATSL